jgi:hypothetical protein
MTGMGTPRPDFEIVTANATGAWERRERDGQTWWVGPAAMLVPGVLNGSKGPLLYTAEDTRAATPAWDKMPITLGHPRDAAGRPVSANGDGVFERLGLGFVEEPRFDGALKAKAWVHEGWAAAIAPDVLNAIKKNEPVELSTGLGTRDEEARPGSVWNGKHGAVGYTHVARDHQPDHLAILVGQRGACSIRDGCGLGVNAFCPTGEGGGVDPSCSPGSGGSWKGGPAFVPPASKYGGTRAHFDPEGGLNPSQGGTSGPQIINLPGGGQRVEFHNRALEDLQGLASDAAARAATDPNWHAEAAEQYANLARALENVTEYAGGGAAKVKEAHDKAEFHRSQTAKKLAGLRADRTGRTVGNAEDDDLPEDTHNGLLLRMWDKVVNAFLPNQPRSQVTGKVKRMNAGQGKGPAHEAAQQGYHGAMTHPSARQRTLGADAARQLAETGHNPPSWAVDEDIWDEAKAAADKGNYEPGSDSYYAVVATIYENMGGEVGKGAPTGNAVTANVVKKVGDKWRVESESGKNLGEYGSEDEAMKRLKQVEFFKHKDNADGGGDPVTANQGQEVDMKTRREKVTFLVANCDCWKGKEQLLNNDQLVDDKGLDLLVSNVQQAAAGKIAVNALKEISKEVGAPDDLAANAMPAFIKKKIDAKKAAEDAADKGADDADENPDGTKKKTANAAAGDTTVNFGNLTAEQKDQLSRAIFGQPVSVVTAGLNLAVNYEQREKQIVINRLTDHLPDGPDKAARQKKLMALNLDELYDRLADRPTVGNGRPDSDDRLPLFGSRAAIPAEPAGGDAAYNESADVWNELVDPTAKWPANRRTRQSDKQSKAA